MILTIAIMVALTVAAAASMVVPRAASPRPMFDATPDQPVAFGDDMAWLAIRTRDTAAVVEALGLAAPEPCNWKSGLTTLYDPKQGLGRIFVSPPVSGWTFVAGLSLPHPVARSFADKCTPLLVGLGGRFAEVHYYFACPVIDYFAWARMIDGRLVRAFAIGDEGIVWNKGRTSREERALGLKLFELRGVRGRRGDAGGEMILHPTGEHVLRLAGKWSLDPSRLDAVAATAGTGVMAYAPLSWKPERLRKSA